LQQRPIVVDQLAEALSRIEPDFRLTRAQLRATIGYRNCARFE
jgi:hypothetical protein